MAANPNQSDILDRLKGLSVAEIAYLDGVVAGTSAASKAIVLDSSSKINAIDITALKLGGTTMSSTAAELNLLDGVSGLVQADFTKLAAVTVTAPEVNLSAGAWASVAFVVGSESGDKIIVTVQFKDAAGVDMAVPVSAEWYLADDSAGLNPTTTAHDGAVATETDGAIIQLTAKLNGRLVSEADGDWDIAMTDAGTFTVYLVIVHPVTGLLSISGAITHAA